MLRIMGIDPGTYVTGFGVVEKRHNSLVCIERGDIRLSKAALLSERIRAVFSRLKTVIAETRPDGLVVENIFYGKNPRSLIQQGQMRGVVILAGAESQTPVYEYSPLEVKMAVVGYGRAEKAQVQTMVKAILNLAELPPSDVADALAVAICHINHGKGQAI